ncbi:unnamed protein product [Notodromas monacha]|uniref:Microtubule-associated protein n=1 Tax=Notodromas monacha TaxID=399045 RepID=A0A7R9BK91_9CRUS|nr:unnamed protein product [Notodromas monacha]CAG0915524.1 unnamed protein product [Notodromas monacha]
MMPRRWRRRKNQLSKMSATVGKSEEVTIAGGVGSVGRITVMDSSSPVMSKADVSAVDRIQFQGKETPQYSRLSKMSATVGKSEEVTIAGGVGSVGRITVMDSSSPVMSKADVSAVDRIQFQGKETPQYSRSSSSSAEDRPVSRKSIVLDVAEENLKDSSSSSSVSPKPRPGSWSSDDADVVVVVSGLKNAAHQQPSALAVYEASSAQHLRHTWERSQSTAVVVASSSSSSCSSSSSSVAPIKPAEARKEPASEPLLSSGEGRITKAALMPLDAAKSDLKANAGVDTVENKSRPESLESTANITGNNTCNIQSTSAVAAAATGVAPGATSVVVDSLQSSSSSRPDSAKSLETDKSMITSPTGIQHSVGSDKIGNTFTAPSVAATSVVDSMPSSSSSSSSLSPGPDSAKNLEKEKSINTSSTSIQSSAGSDKIGNTCTTPSVAATSGVDSLPSSSSLSPALDSAKNLEKEKSINSSSTSISLSAGSDKIGNSSTGPVVAATSMVDTVPSSSSPRPDSAKSLETRKSEINSPTSSAGFDKPVTTSGDKPSEMPGVASGATSTTDSPSSSSRPDSAKSLEKAKSTISSPVPDSTLVKSASGSDKPLGGASEPIFAATSGEKDQVPLKPDSVTITETQSKESSKKETAQDAAKSNTSTPESEKIMKSTSDNFETKPVASIQEDTKVASASNAKNQEIKNEGLLTTSADSKPSMKTDEKLGDETDDAFLKTASDGKESSNDPRPLSAKSSGITAGEISAAGEKAHSTPDSVQTIESSISPTLIPSSTPDSRPQSAKTVDPENIDNLKTTKDSAALGEKTTTESEPVSEKISSEVSDSNKSPDCRPQSAKSLSSSEPNDSKSPQKSIISALDGGVSPGAKTLDDSRPGSAKTAESKIPDSRPHSAKNLDSEKILNWKPATELTPATNGNNTTSPDLSTNSGPIQELSNSKTSDSRPCSSKSGDSKHQTDGLKSAEASRPVSAKSTSSTPEGSTSPSANTRPNSSKITESSAKSAAAEIPSPSAEKPEISKKTEDEKNSVEIQETSAKADDASKNDAEIKAMASGGDDDISSPRDSSSIMPDDDDAKKYTSGPDPAKSALEENKSSEIAKNLNKAAGLSLNLSAAEKMSPDAVNVIGQSDQSVSLVNPEKEISKEPASRGVENRPEEDEESATGRHGMMQQPSESRVPDKKEPSPAADRPEDKGSSSSETKSISADTTQVTNKPEEKKSKRVSVDIESNYYNTVFSAASESPVLPEILQTDDEPLPGPGSEPTAAGDDVFLRDETTSGSDEPRIEPKDDLKPLAAEVCPQSAVCPPKTEEHEDDEMVVAEEAPQSSQPQQTDDRIGRSKEKRSRLPARVSISQGDHDSGVDENTQSANNTRMMRWLLLKKHLNHHSLNKQTTELEGQRKSEAGFQLVFPFRDHAPTKKASSAAKDGKSATRRTGTRSTSRSKSFTREEEPPKELAKKVPMNKVEVGKGPSPNLKSVKSKIGSMENTHYKPGGGNVRIEHKKVEIGEVKPKVGAKNEAYQPSAGGQKKKLFKPPPKQEVEQPPTPAPPATATEKKPVKKFVTTQKLNWSAKSKIGSLENAKYKPKGGDKKIETVKLNFKDKAQSKVASTVNIKHKPGGGEVKTSEKTPEKPTEDEKIAEEIENRKLDFKAESKIGSLGNVKHRPGGGDKAIFDDREYLRQRSASRDGNVGSSVTSSTPEPLQTNGNTADHV